MKILFICSRNKLRSPTGEAVAASLGIDSDSAGLAEDAIQLLEPEQIMWSDVILVMESKHKKKLNQKYSKYMKNKKIVVLEIPDNYDYMQPELVKIFENKLKNYQNEKFLK